MPCEWQHMYMCHNQRQLHHESFNVIFIISNIEMKYHIKYENIWTNNAMQKKYFIKC